MDLESVIQSEVSQNEKNKYDMLTYIWNLKKKNVYEDRRGGMGIETQTY